MDSARTIVLLAVAAVVLAVFAVIEMRLARAPLVPFDVFRSRPVSGANAVMFLIGAAFFSMWYFLSLYLQNVLGLQRAEGRAGVRADGDHDHGRRPGQLAVAARIGVRPLLHYGDAAGHGRLRWVSR